MSSENYYLYKITNLVNGKLYVGITVNPKIRERQHFTKKTTNSLVCRAVKKYGRENFKFEVLCIGTKDYILDLEVKAIEVYNSSAINGHGYNIHSGGLGGSEPRRGKMHSRKDDEAYYVSGFWFPNKRTALSSLNWTSGKFRYRKSIAVLGDESSEYFTRTRNSVKYSPVYYRGFWFPSFALASQMYDMHVENIKKEIRSRRFEQDDQLQDYHIVRKYFVHGNAYDSLEDAANQLEVPWSTVKGRYDRKVDKDNYSYTYIKEAIQCQT